MAKFADTYVIGNPYTSEKDGQSGVTTARWYDKNGHLTGATVNGSGNPSRWTGKTHAEYIAAIRTK